MFTPAGGKNASFLFSSLNGSKIRTAKVVIFDLQANQLNKFV